MKTQYSRRELYALGEPLGESVTRKEGGRIVYGGGGGAPSQTTSTNYTSNIPEYAQPYVEQMLGTAQQQVYNYDANGQPTGMKPYTPYSTDPNAYVAGFSPLQQQGFDTAANMKAGVQGFQQDVGGYMSPYINNVIQSQLTEANRQAGIQDQAQQAQATQAGAFGGGRDAIMRAESARNLAGLQNNIVSQGLQSAYQNAQNQYNTGFGQQQALAGMQNQFGGQQQQLEQGKINQQIQNYATAQQYPMMQLANMSNLLRGLPMQSTTVQGYQASPSPLSQFAGLGATALGAYGASGGFKAKGGLIKDKEKRPAGLAELALSKMQ